ncbi:pyridoxamine 5'-phosphate oxidase family protein [candidate division KSB3 bacterium]|uniref:Pyridoxamine 5'-phosphate oxidase family protein n=1 Tax=candidate division KSB3 bacterium TaxID=2044937 RepID=A0A9D5JUQ7_9BACT|nr:pyridoxamine 5'-phosphate oxidase family protein [candidate division KSB3 bacterium]MBD3324623.1 pyridoxamine 5'-phosphate oxidase family protein [candidate division KSB3 bacterium]
MQSALPCAKGTCASCEPRRAMRTVMHNNQAMRKKDQEITDFQALEDIIRRSQVCRVAMTTDGIPYVVPLCFGYQDRTLYFHTAQEGRKIDILRENPQICVEFDLDYEVVPREAACKWGIRYRSVIGSGRAEFIEDPHAKEAALQVIMQHYGKDQGAFTFSPNSLQRTLIIQVYLDHLSGKMSGYAPAGSSAEASQAL